MYQLSTRFCKPPFCWNPDAPATQCKKQCSPPGSDRAKLEHMERICKEEVNTVAIKTIRFLDLKRLHPFYADSYPIDFKAVFLVRDPRSMYHSRLEWCYVIRFIKKIQEENSPGPLARKTERDGRIHEDAWARMRPCCAEFRAFEQYKNFGIKEDFLSSIRGKEFTM